MTTSPLAFWKFSAISDAETQAAEIIAFVMRIRAALPDNARTISIAEWASGTTFQLEDTSLMQKWRSLVRQKGVKTANQAYSIVFEMGRNKCVFHAHLRTISVPHIIFTLRVETDQGEAAWNDVNALNNWDSVNKADCDICEIWIKPKRVIAETGWLYVKHKLESVPKLRDSILKSRTIHAGNSLAQRIHNLVETALASGKLEVERHLRCNVKEVPLVIAKIDSCLGSKEYRQQFAKSLEPLNVGIPEWVP